MGPRGRRERAGEQSEIFDIFERERDKAIELERERYCFQKRPSAFYEIGSSIGGDSSLADLIVAYFRTV